MSLTLRTFEYEFNKAVNKIEFISELKIIKSSSLFYPLYVMFMRTNEKENHYFSRLCKKIIEKSFIEKQ